MAKKKSIRNRLVVSVLLVAVVSFALSVGVLTVRFASQGRAATEQLLSAKVTATAQRINEPMRQRMERLQIFAQSVSGMSPSTAEREVATLIRIAKRMLMQQPETNSLWAALDYRYFHRNVDSTNENAFRFLHFKSNGKEITLNDTLFAQGDDRYTRLRDGAVAQVLSPRFEVESRTDSTLSLTFIAPVFDSSGRSMGLVGVDVPLKDCHAEAQRSVAVAGAYSMVVANDLTLVSHPNTSNIGQPFEKVLTTMPNIIAAMDRMQQGDTVRMSYMNTASGQLQVFFSAPIRLSQTDTPWAFCEVVPLSSLVAPTRSSLRTIVGVSIVGLLLLVVMLVFIANRLAHPLAKASESLRQLSQGNLDESLRLHVARRDELGEIARSTNHLLEGLRDKAHFAEAIGQGDLTASYDADEGDILGQSLKAMQASLRAASKREEAQRHIENQQAWATKGVAEFSELFRKNTDSIDTFSYQMVRALVEYVGANVGAVFLLEEDGATRPKYYRMAASHAYEVRRYKDHRIELGEGLVGRCGLEKKRILLTDIPSDYVKIASGLGQSTPRALLLVPMMVSEELVGVLEVASFSLFEEYEIRFIESIAGTFAGTLLTVKGNQRTQLLLQEAQEQSKTMREQEDAMRQNLEELRAIQEENEQQKAVTESLEHAVQVACFVAEFDRDARLVRVNDDFLAEIRASREEMIGTHAAEFLSLHQEIARDFSRFWEEILSGATKRQVPVEMVRRNERFHFIETYAPIYDAQGTVTGVLRIGYPAPTGDKEETNA